MSRHEIRDSVARNAPLAQWRKRYHGTPATLAAEAYDATEASARVVAAIIAKGQPVYAINTGFGKLAHVRIDAADLATLQRNIVLSHGELERRYVVTAGWHPPFQDR